MRIYDGTGKLVANQEGSKSSSLAGRRSVGVAEYGVTVDGTSLITSGLGSCVAVGIYDGTVAAGLVHVMLPTADDRPVENPAKFADTGVSTLLGALADAGARSESFAAKMAGGSEMIAFRAQERSIGERNVEAVRTALDDSGVPLLGEDVGGDEGRTVELTQSGDLVVRTARTGERVV